MATPNFHQLRIFLTVAKFQSFSKAARDLSVSQPAVSIQIRELEQYYNMTLLRRAGRRVVLTDVGEVIYTYAQKIFALSEEMEKMVNDFKGLAKGRLVLGASTTIGEYLLPNVIGKFKNQYPYVNIELSIANTDQVVQRVIRHQLDLGFIGESVDSRELHIEPYLLDEIVVITSPQHPFSQLEEVALEALGGEKFVMRENDSATRRVTEKCLSQLGIKPRITMELASTEAVKRAVAVNLGIAMISKYCVNLEVDCGILKIAKIPNLNCQRQLSMIYRKDRVLTRAEKAFLEILKG